jgi:DNA-binding transcriptional ArsR family regulator
MTDKRAVATAPVVDPGEDAAVDATAPARVEPTGPQLSAAANTFDLLSSPVRLHLVWLATHGRYDVGTMAARVGVSIATASQHLGKLRLAGLVTGRRQGKRQIYTVDDPHVLALVEQIFEHIAPDGTLAADPPISR